MKKQCSKCLERKELDEFYKRKTSKDGYRNECKECERKSIKEWRKNNKERLKIYEKEKYKSNKSNELIWIEIVKNKKEYKLKNKEKISLKTKEWRKRNSISIIQYEKEYNNSYILWESIYKESIKLYEEIRQNEEYLEVKCTYCGKWYKPKKLELKNRLKSINGKGRGEQRLYCSTNCKKECPIYGQVKYPKGFKISSSREVQPELRQLVLERDNYTCQKCFKNDVPLHCHHKEGILWESIESADMDMCITYCKNCHKEVHKIEGCSYNDMKCYG